MKNKSKIFLPLILLFLITMNCEDLYGFVAKPKEPIEKIENFNDLLNESLLPENHPLQKKLKNLFKSPDMFNSIQALKRAGFQVVPRVHEGMLVSKHPSIKDYYFKKFRTNVPIKMQLYKYLIRIKGANTIREYIQANNVKHLVVPKKWLYPLPRTFSVSGNQAYILIAEDMNICGGGDNPNGENVRQYAKMNNEMLTELCLIMHRLGGCDAWPRNQPFTKTGKIAFVDTEHVGKKKLHFLLHIIPVLSKENQGFAKDLWNQLEYEEQLKVK